MLEERGDIAIKGKGVMHTWYLVGQRPGNGSDGNGSVQVEPPVREQVDVLGQ